MDIFHVCTVSVNVNIFPQKYGDPFIHKEALYGKKIRLFPHLYIMVTVHIREALMYNVIGNN